MDPQNTTNASKRKLGQQLDDLISLLDSHTIERLLSVLNQYNVVEIIDSLNARMKNPAKRPKLDSSASSDHSSIDLETYVADISTLLDEVQAEQQVQQQQIQRHQLRQIGYQTQSGEPQQALQAGQNNQPVYYTELDQQSQSQTPQQHTQQQMAIQTPSPQQQRDDLENSPLNCNLQIGSNQQAELKPVNAEKTTIRQQMQRSGDPDDLEKSIEATSGELPPPPLPSPVDIRKFVRLANGKILTMSEYHTTLRQNQQPRAIVRPVQTKEVAPFTPPQTPPSQDDVREREIATMLVILQSGEQRLIKFIPPKERYAVHELLEQVGVPVSVDSNVQCISSPGTDIDYIVTVGTPNDDSKEMLTATENLLKSVLAAQQTIKEQTVYAQIMTPPKAKSPEPLAKQEPPSKQGPPPKAKSPEPLAKQKPPPKYVRGLLAVCSHCGSCSLDHAICHRCMSPFGNTYKTVPYSSQQQPVKPGVVKGKAFDQLDRAKLELKRTRTERGNNASKNGNDTPLPGKVVAPLRFEPTVTEEMKVAEAVGRRDITKITQMLEFKCRTIQIGSHKYKPTEKVVITANGVQIVAPNVKRPNKQVVLNIQSCELFRLIYHFSKSMSVIFLYTAPSCGANIRKSLEMGPPSKKRPYYDPLSKEGHFKRIVLVLGATSEVTDRQLKEVIENGKLEEINLADAKELLWCSVPSVAEPPRY